MNSIYSLSKFWGILAFILHLILFRALSCSAQSSVKIETSVNDDGSVVVTAKGEFFGDGYVDIQAFGPGSDRGQIIEIWSCVEGHNPYDGWSDYCLNSGTNSALAILSLNRG